MVKILAIYGSPRRKGNTSLLLKRAVEGATKGKKLFDGALLSIRYFFDALDLRLWRALCYRQLDFEGDILRHPEYLEEAHRAGKDLVHAIQDPEA